jgi:hypothetical protein
MSISAEFEGTIAVDGLVRSLGVGVWMSDTDFVLREVPQFGLCQFKIFLDSFDQSMILTHDPDLMKEGLRFDMEGEEVGMVSDGPLGHPGDNEINRRPIIAFRTTAVYFTDRIEVDIDGQTTSGIDAFDANKMLQPVQFAVHFAIPKERVADFFQMDEFAHCKLIHAFSQAFS